jgi:hypothetical protein
MIGPRRPLLFTITRLFVSCMCFKYLTTLSRSMNTDSSVALSSKTRRNNLPARRLMQKKEWYGSDSTRGFGAHRI